MPAPTADPAMIGVSEKDTHNLQGGGPPSFGQSITRSASNVADIGVRAAGAPGVDPQMLELQRQMHAARKRPAVEAEAC